ncbi:ribosomal protein S18-alanine N-acetyltransferase [Piscinibacter sakaiensis]|uniref:ribosomal protein S18-alanine N-acetyltransferase n=1 Tax=Piscinibacter sakaiensis TaxID=1547922 RepID=UPI003AAE3ECA
MNAVVKPHANLRAMLASDLPAVLAIEQAAYEFPWTRGNFLDSLHAGYLARLMFDERGRVIGYFIAMSGVDEMHLLNLSVAPALQGRGHGRAMLDALLQLCREHGAGMLWLEVRTSNLRARSLYRRLGFSEIGIRRGYYPAAGGAREDAIVMSLATAPMPGASNGPADGLD